MVWYKYREPNIFIQLVITRLHSVRAGHSDSDTGNVGSFGAGAAIDPDRSDFRLCTRPVGTVGASASSGATEAVVEAFTHLRQRNA